jgi:hypothetical protein
MIKNKQLVEKGKMNGLQMTFWQIMQLRKIRQWLDKVLNKRLLLHQLLDL